MATPPAAPEPSTTAAGRRADLPFPAPRWEIFSWCMFDFANSSFTTIVVTVVFARYFTEVVCGLSRDADFLWGVGNFASQLVIFLTAPVLGAIADYSGSKKKFLTATWLGCCVFTSFLYVVGPGDVVLALGLFVLANICYSAGENFTASFLPEIARPEDMGRVSGYGWAWGYMGGLASLAICYPLLLQGHKGATNLVVAGFFFLAGLPTILFLRERKLPAPLPAGRGYVGTGLAQVRDTLKHVRRFKQLARFLVVFSLYNSGLIVVVNYGSIYASQTMGLGEKELLLFFLLLQITSTIGAFLFGHLQDRLGARVTIQITLCVWVAFAVIAYLATSKAAFYFAGNLAGLAIGSSQSASRAFVGLLSPKTHSAEFFGFWSLFSKLSAALAPLTFGAASSAFGQRPAILVTAVFFLAGFLGMFFVDEKEGARVARAYGGAAGAAGGEPAPA